MSLIILHKGQLNHTKLNSPSNLINKMYFFQKMLIYDPSKRISAKDALQSPIFYNINHPKPFF